MGVSLSFVIQALALLHIGALAQMTSTQCRCFPGDDCWPSPAEWSAFNDTLGGKLIATVPIASPCHDDQFSTYNAEKCSKLQSNFFLPETHIGDPSSIMGTFWTNNSCNPFASESTGCTIGNYVSYSVNATSSDDFKTTLNFTTTHNIRVTIKNTGHDYNGKGTGAGAVAIWTHNMKSLQLINLWTSSNYTGPAIKVDAGVEVHELYQFAHDNGLIAVGANCPTIGVAGGYTQGGGYGPLASRFGMASDNVLQWEVVTATGEFLTASPHYNSDIYWALSGGGGGTFGVVSSVTLKAYPDLKTSAANLTFSRSGNNDSFWDIVQIWQDNLSAMVDEGCVASFKIGKGVFTLELAMGPGISLDDLQSLMEPTISALNTTNITYEYNIAQYDTFLDAYKANTPSCNVSQTNIGSRLIPRSLVQQNSSALIEAMKSITNSGATIRSVGLNVSQSVPSPDSNAVNPYWRNALLDMMVEVDFSYTNWTANYDYQNQLTHGLLPQLEALTPNGGAYLNEADFQQPDWQNTFYGDHYATLLSIKQKYDPNDIFWAVTAVGSDAWYEDQSQGGRLCPASSS